MQILQLNQRMATLVGVCSLSDENQNDFRWKFGQIFGIVLVFITLISYEWLSADYAVDHLHLGDVENSLFALVQVIATLSLFASYISLVYRKRDVHEFFERMQNIFDQYEGTPSVSIYLRANKLCEIFFKWATNFILVSYFVTTFVPSAVGVLFCYVKDGCAQPAELYELLPLKFRIPFNENSIEGFAVILAVNLFIGLIFLTVTITNVSLFLCMGLYLRAFCSHFQLMFRNMSELAVGNSPAFDRRILLKSSLIEVIDFHNQAKDVFELCREVMSATVFFQVTTAALLISCANVQVEMIIKSLDFRIFVALISIFMSVGMIFLYCSVGSFTVDNFWRYAEISYESLWYEFPVELQTYLVLMIADAQQPRVFKGFGFIDLNLMAFTKILNATLSYYLMFKSFTN